MCFIDWLNEILEKEILFTPVLLVFLRVLGNLRCARLWAASGNIMVKRIDIFLALKDLLGWWEADIKTPHTTYNKTFWKSDKKHKYRGHEDKFRGDHSWLLEKRDHLSWVWREQRKDIVAGDTWCLGQEVKWSDLHFDGVTL